MPTHTPDEAADRTVARAMFTLIAAAYLLVFMLSLSLFEWVGAWLSTQNPRAEELLSPFLSAAESVSSYRWLIIGGSVLVIVVAVLAIRRVELHHDANRFLVSGR